MAIRLRRVLCLAAIVGATAPAHLHAQARTVELDLTAGYSGEEIRAAAVQLRTFGEVSLQSKIQYFGEVAWGQRWSNEEAVYGSQLIGTDVIGSDVFGSAYSYRKTVQVTEAYVERSFRPRGAMLSLRGGQYRTPFGIYSRSDYSYIGFIRPPLIRYDGYFALSNNYMERGAMISAGVPQLSVEASLGRPHDVGSSQRRNGTDESVRVQGYRGDFIVGVSHARSEPYMPATFAFGRQVFTGADARWTHHSGVQLRGEFVHGHSFDGVTTDGWYVDGFVHHIGMGPITAVARVEKMAYTAPAPRSRAEHRVTLGTRVRLPGYFTAQLNYMHQRGDLTRIYDNSVDFAVTYFAAVPLSMVSSTRQQIPWHRRMEARVAIGVIFLVTLSLAGVLLAAIRVTTRSSVEQAQLNLKDAQAAFYKLVEDRADFAAAETRLIVALPLFRSQMINPVIGEDLATLTESADGYRKDLGAEFCILTNSESKPTATPGWTGGAAFPAGLQATIKGAAAGESRWDIVPIGDRLFLITSEPAKFAETEVLGTVTFGFALGDKVAQELAQRTHAEVNLVAGTTLVGSSLPANERREVSDALTAGPSRQTSLSPGLRKIGSRRFIEGTFSMFPNRPSDQVGHLVLLQDWAPTQRFIDELTQSLLLAGVIGFALALTGGLIFSRRTSRPLMDIAAAARDIAAGDWTRQVPVRGSAEAETMASSFNEMTTSLRDQAEDLRKAYQRFSTVTQSARDAIISTNDRGQITFWNRSAEHIFGYSEVEVLGEALTMLIAESDREAYASSLPEPTDNDLTFGHTIEVTALRKDGGRFPCEFSLAALRGPQGLALTAIVRDVTERKQVQDALHQRDEQLRQAQKMEAIGRLAGGVAHDFNNLLMAIRGYAELLIQGFEDGDERKADAGEILKASDRAAGLTRQLLAFGRRQVITQQAVALDQLVEDTQNMLRRLIGEDIKLVTEVWPGLTPVLADKTQVEQILVNLAVNARDAMPSGGTILMELRNIELDAIGVAAHPGLTPGDYVEMSIADTGGGMDSETASRIFEPFFTTKENGKGTGLGLATVYGIVQQSGGAIEVQSKLGHGTTFYIYLPRATDLGKPAPPRMVATGGSETVLLAEDDDRVRVLVANMLKKNGYTVLLASAGDQALEIAARYHGRIHLLLTDVVMPGMSGRVLSERLMLSRTDTRVLYMSGYSDDAILRHGVKSAGTHFIQKPFSIETLAEKIREALGSTSSQTTKS